MSLDTEAHRHCHCQHHSERLPPARDPCANKCRDTENRWPATAAKPPDSAPGAHSASKRRTDRQGPAPRSNEFPAIANLQSWREQIPLASAADPDPHSAKLKFPDSRSPFARRSRRSAHDQCATARSATGRGVRDNYLAFCWLTRNTASHRPPFLAWTVTSMHGDGDREC